MRWNVFAEKKVAEALFTKPYGGYFILWLVLFSALNFFGNQLHVTGSMLFSYTLNVLVPFVLFLIVNTFMVALVINLIIMRIQEAKTLDPKEGGLSAAGAFVALLTGACPGCIAGIFPALMGAFGSQITLSGLPFYGLELQALSFVLLYVGAAMLSGPMMCAVKKK